MKYKYKAMTSEGKEVEGTVDANDKAAAVRQLREHGWHTYDIFEQQFREPTEEEIKNNKRREKINAQCEQAEKFYEMGKAKQELASQLTLKLLTDTAKIEANMEHGLYVAKARAAMIYLKSLKHEGFTHAEAMQIVSQTEFE